MRTPITPKGGTAVSVIAAGFALAAALSGCSAGPGLDGTYYSDDGQLVVAGTSITYYAFDCSESERGVAVLDNEPSAQGTLADDGEHVVWKTDDEHLDHDKVGGSTAVVASGGVIRLAGHSFAAKDHEEALRSYDGMC